MMWSLLHWTGLPPKKSKKDGCGMDFCTKVVKNRGMGQFQPGQLKPFGSGRKKGTANKKTLALEEALASHGIDPIGQLAAALPQLSPDRRAEVLLDLVSYLYPKRKAVELSGGVERNHKPE